MNIKRILLIAGAVVCLVAGFLAAQYVDRVRYEERAERMRQSHGEELAALRSSAGEWAESVARAQGEAVLRAFVAGISPAVLAERRETIEIAGVSLLRVSGVAGIHVLGLNGEVLYSSDAKLSTTGEASYRGQWALGASELTSQPSTRPGVIDLALPIVNAGQRLAVAWLEYDLALVQEAARPAALEPPTPPSPPAAPVPPAQNEALPVEEG